MKKWLLLALVLGLIAAGFHLFGPKPPQAAQNEFAAAAELLGDPALKNFANQPRLVANQAIAAPDNSQATPDCLQFLSEIQRLDLNQLPALLSAERLPKDDLCVNKPAALDAAAKEYSKECLSLSSGGDVQAARCLSALHFLRAGISAWQTGDQSVDAINDMSILSDRLSLAFKAAMTNPLQAANLSVVAERMLVLDPKLYAAAKAALIGALLSTQDAAALQSTAYWDNLEKYLDRAKALNAADAQLQDMETMIRTHGFNPEYCAQVLEPIAAQNPAAASAWELLAYCQWKLNNRERSFESMRRAMALNPSDSWLQQVWSRINDPRADTDSFPRNAHYAIPWGR